MKRVILLVLGGFMFIVAVNGLAASKSASNHHIVKSTVTQSVSKTVNINRASQAQLEDLKGLGVKKAAAIIAYRKDHGDFNSIDDLDNVPGIGSKLVQRLEKQNPDRMVVKAARGKSKS